MGLNRMLFKNGNKDDFILYLERTIETFKDDNIDGIGEYAFSDCTSLTSVYLPNVTSIYDYAFSRCLSLTSVHFAAKNKETIEVLSGYSSKFDATNATIYFDL